ncbi:hypothetical protein [Fusobacterium sp.]|uniref:hypothetical protein n=1 Tax=Fusobacterium sp. TaxID=68766 RepID=UPI002612D397|nr:hypothetical protein [Fusobacterium sp.]
MKNKKILLSQDLSFGTEYLNEILQELKKRFEEVYTIEHELGEFKKNFNYKFFREITKKFKEKNVLKRYFYKYEKIKIKENLKKYSAIDYFFIIGNRDFSPYFFKILKELNPQIKIILFLWDKLEYSCWNAERIKYIDFVFSYDREDARKNNFIFRPTFYIKECLKEIPEKKEYALYYVGALRDKKRYKYILTIKNHLDNLGLKSFLKLYVDKNNKKYLENKKTRELFISNKISYLENLKNLKKSRAVLDIKYKNQKGLTLRVYEALAMDIKIITDNDDIKNYDFYNEKNIKIINNINEIEKIDINFFKEEPEIIPEDIKYKYSIDGFIDEIIRKVEE